MNRILVTGNAGSGKTTLSAKIAKSLGLNMFGLDSVVWKPGWVPASQEEKKSKIQDLINKESWVIDGVSGQVFEAADIIFFLDIPLYRCLINIIKRFFSNGFKTREFLPENCPEYIGVFKAIRIAFIYQRSTRPYLLNMIEKHKEKKIIIINSYDQIHLTSLFKSPQSRKHIIQSQ